MVSSIIFLVGLGCLLYFIINHSVESPKHQTVVVFFNSTAKIAQTDDDYICATLDWWPSDKCDYGSCSWGMASLLNLDLNNTILSNAVKAFTPLKIRMGGTLQDKLTYQTNDEQPCNPFVRDSSQLLGFSEGCLPMARWDELNRFFKETGCVLCRLINFPPVLNIMNYITSCIHPHLKLPDKAKIYLTCNIYPFSKGSHCS